MLTNEDMQILDIEYHAPLGKSDHGVITFKYHCYLDYSQPKERYVYHKIIIPMILIRWEDNLYYLTG